MDLGWSEVRKCPGRRQPDVDRVWNQQMGSVGQRQRRRSRGEANYRLIRYADDFVIVVPGERQNAERLRQEVAGVIAPMGLRLSPAKTRMVHIDHGFDFLGFHIRRMRKRGSNKWFVYTKPSTKAIATVKGRVKAMTYRSTLHREPGYLLEYLGRVLRGWANYFRHGVSKAVFAGIDSYAWERITNWPREFRLRGSAHRTILSSSNNTTT